MKLLIIRLLVLLIIVIQVFSLQPEQDHAQGDEILSLPVSTTKNDDTQDSKEPRQDANEHVPREIPTREEDGWRRLGENESAPFGSHIRLNMTSGEKWLKVPSTRGEQILAIMDRLPDANLSERINSIRTNAKPGTVEFESAVSDLWKERQALLGSGKNETEQSEPRVTHLSKQLSPVLATDVILEELAELVEDLDQAATFANDHHQGISKCLLLIDDSSTSHQVKTLAASVIGKTVKSTNELQMVAVKLGSFEKLHRAFQDGQISESKALYAIGSLIRGSSEAAAEALKSPELFSSLVTRLNDNTEVRIRERVAALIGDLLHEPGKWCWTAFKEANLCHRSLDFTQEEIENSQHLNYLHLVREEVCMKDAFL